MYLTPHHNLIYDFVPALGESTSVSRKCATGIGCDYDLTYSDVLWRHLLGVAYTILLIWRCMVLR